MIHLILSLSLLLAQSWLGRADNCWPNKAENALSTRSSSVHNVSVDGVDLFYREAGNQANPAFLLLHGYPSSSHQYRHLIPILAAKYHVIAPDFPGFGFTTVPDSRNYNYTFDDLSATTAALLSVLQITSYIMYIFDYGAPVGLRLALQDPSAVRAIITQNGNSYVEGLGPAFSALSDYYTDPANKTNEQAVRDFDSFAGTKMQYTVGAPNPAVIEPESYTLDAALLAAPGNVDIQLALFRNYITNVEMYPQYQAYLRVYQPPVLAVWGANDQIFIPAGAEAYKRDVPAAEVDLLDGGHFLLETNLLDVANLILRFLARNGL